jgi:16S rRNA (guanine527-N7)-methyltransferase
MTEAEAQDWLREHLHVSRETIERLESFVAYLKRESASQNLIAASTLDTIWSRHIVDSAQLLRYLPTPGPEGAWLDLGSGAGFPGIVAALLTDMPVTLVESRAKRIEYLERAVTMLDLEDRVSVAGMPLEKLKTAPFSVISARAFAPLPRLLALSARFSTKNTIWLLPKGRNARRELEEAQSHWSLDFHVEPSFTDDEAGIIIGKLRNQQPFNPKKQAEMT